MVECLLCMQEVGGSIPEQVLYFQSWFRMFSSCQACRTARVRLGASGFVYIFRICFMERKSTEPI